MSVLNMIYSVSVSGRRVGALEHVNSALSDQEIAFWSVLFIDSHLHAATSIASSLFFQYLSAASRCFHDKWVVTRGFPKRLAATVALQSERSHAFPSVVVNATEHSRSLLSCTRHANPHSTLLTHLMMASSAAALSLALFSFQHLARNLSLAA